jgi:hypothetical protein
VLFNAEGLSSGVYICNVKIDYMNFTQKMNVIR